MSGKSMSPSQRQTLECVLTTAAQTDEIHLTHGLIQVVLSYIIQEFQHSFPTDNFEAIQDFLAVLKMIMRKLRGLH